jgi:tRNA(Ile)-lysidine synthase
MLANLRQTTEQDCRLDLTRPVLVGVSGGADSLCLLDALAALGYRVVAAHFNHRLRPGADEDAAAVRDLAAGMGIPFAPGSADVGAYARATRQSLEAAARRLRYRFLFEQGLTL